MAKVPILIALLPQLLYTLLQVSGQQSPCPQYFTYVSDPATNEVKGQVQISSPPKNVNLHLKVALSIAVALPTKYVGQLELVQSKEESVRIVQQGRPLLYYIRFPLRQPIPLLTGLWFNHQQYCSGPRATGQIVTSIQLEHTLYPPNALPLSHSSLSNNSLQNLPMVSELNTFLPTSYFLSNNSSPNQLNTSLQTTHFVVRLTPPSITYKTSPPPQRPVTTQGPPNWPVTTQRPPNWPVTTQRPKEKSTTSRSTTVKLSDRIADNIFLNPPPRQSNNNNECGVSTHLSNSPTHINLLIAKGMKATLGQWPWLAALFVVKISYEFQCAGSVLTNKHVITAAHCFKLDAQTNIPPSAMVVSLGRYQLRDYHKAGSVNKEIARYIIHPDYLHQVTGDSDLAILILREPVEFSPTIKPVCIWSGPTDLQSAVNKIGYVVGWGRDEFGNLHLAEPRMAKVPIVSQEVCLWSDPRFVFFTSNRTFCAGSQNGSGPCNGDSGSGLVIHDSTTGRFQLRGIVSRSLYDRDQMTCDLTQYVVFVDVAKYLPLIWIPLDSTIESTDLDTENVASLRYIDPHIWTSPRKIAQVRRCRGIFLVPSIMYAPIAEQIDVILESMENNLPKYVLPAISLIRRSLSKGVLDADEIYRPTFGPPKADPLEKIPLAELKRAASPLSYRNPIKALVGSWPKIIGETASLINNKIIPPRRELIAYMLANLRIPDATPEVRESVALLVEHLQSHGERELVDFSMSPDPYVLVANAISSLSSQNEILIDVHTLLPFLKKPAECRESSKFASFFQNNTINYTLLILRDRVISRSKAGVELLSMMQNNTDVQDTVEQLSPFEYASWRDLLLAFISQLRRRQTHQDRVSDIVDSVYGELILKNVRKHWQLLRNSITATPVLTAIARKESSSRIRRLLMEVALDRSIGSEVWQKALAFASSEDISGPMDAVLKTLKAFLASGLLGQTTLFMNIAELVTTYDNRINEGQAECVNRLEMYLTNLTEVDSAINKMTIQNVDIKDLLQALPDLDVYTDEYRSLKSFLSQRDLEAKIGQVDIKAHPTRGRLLAQLFQMTGYADGIDDSLRYLAQQFVDNVAYEGYGAGALLYRSS